MCITKKLKQVVLNACLYFTASEFFILILAKLFSETSPTSGGAVGKFLSLGATTLVFFACLALSALNLVLKANLPRSVRIVCHFLGCLAVWTLVTVMIPAAYVNPLQVLIRLIFFAVVYAIIAFIAAVIQSIIKNRRSEDKEYESAFGKGSKQ